jgi:hypothetical protein
MTKTGDMRDLVTEMFSIIMTYCYHWKKLGKEYMKALYYFLYLHVNLK